MQERTPESRALASLLTVLSRQSRAAAVAGSGPTNAAWDANAAAKNASAAADFQFLSRDVAAYCTRHNDSVGADVLTSHTSCFAYDEHTAKGDLTFERSLNADAARAINGAVPDDARAEHRGDALNGLDRLWGFSGGGIAFEHIRNFTVENKKGGHRTKRRSALLLITDHCLLVAGCWLLVRDNHTNTLAH